MHESGMLDVGDAQHIYWERRGNPGGIPAVYLYGGPGAGCTPGSRRLFDEDVYRAVFFDQRGCGRSRPSAGAGGSDLACNTTAHLVADIEKLRVALNIERWTVLGVSWGTTLALAYAQRHPQRVVGLVLALVTTTSRREVEWIARDVGRLFPAAFERFVEAVPQSLRHLDVVDAYASLVLDADPSVHDAAARAWCTWEDVHVSLASDWRPNARFTDATFRLVFARLVTHYWRHAAFLDDEQLLRDASSLDGIPGVLIHGGLDVSSPVETAWRLSKAWTTGRLHVLDDMGHGGGDGFSSAVVNALREVTALAGRAQS